MKLKQSVINGQTKSISILNNKIIDMSAQLKQALKEKTWKDQ